MSASKLIYLRLDEEDTKIIENIQKEVTESRLDPAMKKKIESKISTRIRKLGKAFVPVEMDEAEVQQSMEICEVKRKTFLHFVDEIFFLAMPLFSSHMELTSKVEMKLIFLRKHILFLLSEQFLEDKEESADPLRKYRERIEEIKEFIKDIKNTILEQYVLCQESLFSPKIFYQDYPCSPFVIGMRFLGQEDIIPIVPGQNLQYFSFSWIKEQKDVLGFTITEVQGKQKQQSRYDLPALLANLRIIKGAKSSLIKRESLLQIQQADLTLEEIEQLEAILADKKGELAHLEKRKFVQQSVTFCLILDCLMAKKIMQQQMQSVRVTISVPMRSAHIAPAITTSTTSPRISNSHHQGFFPNDNPNNASARVYQYILGVVKGANNSKEGLLKYLYETEGFCDWTEEALTALLQQLQENTDTLGDVGLFFQEKIQAILFEEISFEELSALKP